MAKEEKKDLLLSSLEEIKKESLEELPAEPTPAPIAPAPAARRAATSMPSGLLDSLLSEVKAEADREVQEITRNLEERTQQEQKFKEAEQRKKKEQYDKLIQEEARRRMDLIKRREEEHRQRQEQAAAKERERQAHLKKQEEVLQRSNRAKYIYAGIAGGAAVIAIVLVATGVIPLWPEEPPKKAEQAAAPAAKPQPLRRLIEEDNGEPAILDAESASLTMDGPAVAVLALPDRRKLEELSKPRPPALKAAGMDIDESELRGLLAKGLSHLPNLEGGGQRHGSGGSSGEGGGGIKIDDSIFKD
jgi:hypothetical protein